LYARPKQRHGMALQIKTKRVEPDILVVELAGRMVFGPEIRRFEERFDELLGQGERKLLFDLSDVESIDSTGIEVVASCFAKATRAGGELRVACVPDKVHRVFKILRLDTILPLYPTLAAASEAFTVTGDPDS
jgi:anti-sigma B factor antagonist